MLLTVCLFEAVINISKSGGRIHAAAILNLVVGNLLLDLLVRCVILTVREASGRNANAVSYRHLASEPRLHLVVSLQVGVRLLCLSGLVRGASMRFAGRKVLRAMKIRIIASENSPVTAVAHGAHLSIAIITWGHEVISRHPKIDEAFLVFLSFV